MKFTYKARTSENKIQTGTMEAENQQGAVDTLRQNNLVIISILPKSKTSIFSLKLGFLSRVMKKQLVIFTRQFAVLIESQVPVVQALKTLKQQTKNKVLQESIFNILKNVEGGSSLSVAMSEQPKIFSQFYVNIIKTGEISGSMQKSLLYLADHLEREYDLRHKIKGALAYPIFVTISFIGVAVAMMVFVIPNLVGIIEESGQEIPLQTRMLIGVSNLLRNYWWAWIVVVIAVFLIFSYLIRSPQGKKTFDVIKLKIPIFGSLLKKVYLARLAENLSTLVSSGITIIQSLEVTANTIGNNVYKEILLQTAQKVRIGEPISKNLKQHKEIPFMVAQMIEIGEQTGRLDKVLGHIAKFYSKEVDSAVGTITQLIEPILIVAMGIGVTILVSAILLPIYQISSGAGM